MRMKEDSIIYEEREYLRKRINLVGISIFLGTLFWGLFDSALGPLHMARNMGVIVAGIIFVLALAVGKKKKYLIVANYLWLPIMLNICMFLMFLTFFSLYNIKLLKSLYYYVGISTLYWGGLVFTRIIYPSKEYIAALKKDKLNNYYMVDYFFALIVITATVVWIKSFDTVDIYNPHLKKAFGIYLYPFFWAITFLAVHPLARYKYVYKPRHRVK